LIFGAGDDKIALGVANGPPSEKRDRVKLKLPPAIWGFMVEKKKNENALADNKTGGGEAAAVAADARIGSGMGDMYSVKEPHDRNYKDTAFRTLVREPERSVEVANALTDGNFSLEKHKLIPVDLEDSLKTGKRHDVAFFLAYLLVFLLEHQSTVNPNMILRLLEYLIFAYMEYLKDTGQDVMSSTAVTIPAPVITVFYNGKTRLREDQKTLRLSDLFADAGLSTTLPTEIEFKIKVVDLHDNADPFTAQLLAKSPTLKGYAELTARISGNIGSGMSVADAIKEAIEHCIGQGGAISGFLAGKRKDMVDMLFMEATEERRVEDGVAEGEAKGKAEGKAEGKVEGKAELIKSFLDGGMPIEQIAAFLKTTVDGVKSLLGGGQDNSAIQA
jgi:hypothetical protein